METFYPKDCRAASKDLRVLATPSAGERKNSENLSWSSKLHTSQAEPSVHEGGGGGGGVETPRTFTLSMTTRILESVHIHEPSH